MADRLLVDLGSDGRVSVGSWLDGELPPLPREPQELTWPLDDDALEDLRWYLEDYLFAPFGVYGERGPRVQAALTPWGRAVFSAIFGGGPARDAYVRVRARGSAELVFRSASPELLGLPWELVADPAVSTPLALDLAGVSRSLPVDGSAETIPVPEGRLRVLMVISRPAGTGDVGYRMIARPLLERLEAVRGQVDLVVLRPPTLDALAGTLKEAKEAGEPFQVVHFDGHGKLTGRRAAGERAPLAFAGPGPEGMLVFEKPTGGPDEVSASRVAQELSKARVPVVVLNACQSGAIGKDLEAAIATQLLLAGVASVVAMAYTVYAVAAAEFMAAFYEQLFAGSTVTAAVTGGRQRLYQRNLRPSPKGELPLADWLVPVHYLRRDVSFPQAKTQRSAGLPPLDQVLDAQRQAAAATGTGDLDAVGSFVGRDDLFFQLEAAARLQKVVVLHGPGGTGKTELAKAFGRWWRDTGGVDPPERVFWHSFEPGVASFGLDSVITQIGLRLYGDDFGRWKTNERLAVVRKALTDHRMLLIWDNFESVRSMPDPHGVTKPLDEAGCAELREFLAHLAARGHSAVLITSRTPETWLGDVRRMNVGGLAAHEAIEYADNLLAPYPSAAPQRARRAFGDLMEWLDGHPLSMRLILPLLDTTGPEAVLTALQGTAPLPATDGEDRTTSLPASISYSFTHLSEPTRCLLPAVCLFHGVADANVLEVFSQIPEVPRRFQGAGLQDWVRALEDAVRVGLLTGLGRGMYRVPPALPGYLATWWRHEEPANHDAMREAATKALLSAYAELGKWLYQQISSGDAALAQMVIRLERRTLGNLLGYAVDHELWDEAALIALPLDYYWDTQGLNTEAGAWTDRVRLATEGLDGTPPQLNTPEGSLWLFFTGNQANRQLIRHQLDDAEHTYRQILKMLQAQPSPLQDQQLLATAYHQLAMIAKERSRLDEAEEWYLKSLAIEEELKNKPGTALTCHELGSVALRRGEVAKAKGRMDEAEKRLGEAEKWYRRSLAIKEGLGNKPYIPSTYLQLGILAHTRGRLEEAEEWYLKSLAIEEELKNKPGMAGTYHELGRVAQDQRRLEEAEEWYLKSLAIKDELGDKPGMALTFGQLGSLAQARRQDLKALEWIVSCVALFDEFPHPATGPAPDHLASLTATLGMKALEQCWQQVTGSSLPEDVRRHVEETRDDR